MEQVLAAYEKGDYKKADEYAAIITNAVQDPSAEYLLAMAMYHEGKMTDAFRAMRIRNACAPDRLPVLDDVAVRRCFWATARPSNVKRGTPAESLLTRRAAQMS